MREIWPRSRGAVCVWCALTLLLGSGVPALAGVGGTGIAGHWEGAVVRLGSMQAVSVDFEEEGGALKGTYDIPDLNLYGEPLADVRYDPPALEFRFLYGSFAMRIHDDVAEMTAENAKWNPPIALHLKRVPARAPSYREEDVRFVNGRITLAGTLFEPAMAGPYAAVVVIQGSGPEGRGHWEYRGLGPMFARMGVAALVYDKRGVGESTGVTDDATFADLARDAAAGVAFLARRPGIDARRIGLFGTSQGGWIAPLAATYAPGVAFLILEKGPAVPVDEQELQRVEYTLRAEHFSDEDVAEALAYTRLVFRVANTGEGRTELAAFTDKIRGKKWVENVQLVTSDKDLDGWRRQRYDPTPVLRRTRIPVLAIFGEQDTLVPPAGNVAKMRELLNDAGNRDVSIAILPGEGHNRYLGATLEGGHWAWPDGYWVWDKVSPRLIETIDAWLGPRVRALRHTAPQGKGAHVRGGTGGR